LTTEQINQKLSDKNMLLTDIYFEIQADFEKRYGDDVLIFLELGSFFEIYSVDNETMQIGKAKEVAEMLNIQLTRKNKSIAENSIKNPFMAGVPTVSFERHLNRLIQEQKFTIILIRQKGEPPNVTRYLHQIISPGTNFDYVADSGENFIVALTVDVHKNIYSIGYSGIDVSTGISYVSEIHGTAEDPNFALDEVFNLLHIYKTSEIVLNFLTKFVNQQKVLEYLEIKRNYHYSVHTKRVKIEFQNELFRRVYKTNSFLSPIEELNLERIPLASESLAILIEFIFSHDFKIVEKLNRPEIIENRNFLYLGNSAIEQLNIISTSSDEKRVLDLIDKTSTAMGKRLLKTRLLHPIFEKSKLLERYDFVDRVSPHLVELDSNLRRIYDLERILRRVKIQKLHPLEINYLYGSLIATLKISEIVKKNLIANFSFSDIELRSMIDRIENYFNLEITSKYNQDQIAENIFLKGVSLEIDRVEKDISGYLGALEKIGDKIYELLKKQNSKNDRDMVSIGVLEKEGHYISLTNTRFKSIEKEFHEAKIILGSEEYLFKDFKIRKLSNSVKITSDVIDKFSEQINNSKAKLIALVKEEFLRELRDFEIKHSLAIERVIEFLGNIDVAVSTGKVARDFQYSRPEIIESSTNQNILQISELRHPLIEQREANGIYIPNDIFLGEKSLFSETENFNKSLLDVTEADRIDGMLLYGINSSGKSSLMKSVGIAIVLAQSGFFVPAKAMKFTLFKSLFTRIVSKDNLSKGLSSFAVEMMELKNIFNRAGENSIVLGDEISHGTETLSGVSIVSSAILRLVEKRSLFIFATHLHQLQKIDEVQNLGTVVNLHLAVRYDEEKDKLIFNRKLEMGSGSSVYGLEFARSLHIDERFLSHANSIRKRLSDEYSDVELILQKKRSRYNSNLYLTKCIICGENVDDVHHISQKKIAKMGFIGHFSKNHKHNLVPLCKKHHLEIHSGKIEIKGFMTTSNGLELHYEESGENID
jgi:DNA mismatch repair protein MutS